MNYHVTVFSKNKILVLMRIYRDAKILLAPNVRHK